VLFGGPYDRRELDVPGGTEKISLPYSRKQPEVYITYEFTGVGTDKNGKHLSFYWDSKSGATPQSLLGRSG
jgi:hypothetical protein